MNPPRIVCIIGTRPEAIKMAPVVKALQESGFDAPILATAQHRDLLDQVLSAFNLTAQWDLNAMTPNQGLSELVARILPQIEQVIRQSRAAAVLAQGDTTTVVAAALAAFHARVPFGHVEAGLRSGSMDAPFPEEGNRRLTSVLTRWHFAPTELSRRALLAENVPQEGIHVVGNSVIDALLGIAHQPTLPWPDGVPQPSANRRMVLVTLHRRENFGAPFEAIFKSLQEFALRHPDADLVYPVHPNPNVMEPARSILAGLPNVYLIAPVDYPAMINLLRHAYMVFTDSGGLQEEAPALGIPVLVFRDVTERPEAVSAGGVRLVGADPDRFHSEAEALWHSQDHYAAMARPRFPYGDGKTSQRIASILRADLVGDALTEFDPEATASGSREVVQVAQ
ncbi:MAG: UDP-N-acetylglucosamine 2-epimerase (non-hydrolyzing) [Planctomycetes bacterium]|nr:UDP-N-acetylglucosamine 2-epimerase (non-hydrolyzing) [Planctomycetota bacterium]